jgi:hypothetical protein
VILHRQPAAFFAPLRLVPAPLADAPLADAPLIPTALVPGFDVTPPVDLSLEALDVAWQTTTSGGRRNWLLLDGFAFDSAVLQRVVEVPPGFVTDFASIPRPLWSLLPPTGTYGRAAVIHDFLYRAVGYCPRAAADRTLLEAMTVLGVARLTRWAIYGGVRLGGASSYQGGL